MTFSVRRIHGAPQCAVFSRRTSHHSEASGRRVNRSVDRVVVLARTGPGNRQSRIRGRKFFMMGNGRHNKDVCIFHGVVLSTGPGEDFKGKISGNTFTATLPGSLFNEPGITCTGTVTAKGTGSGDTFTETFSGSIVCNGVKFTFSGTFTVKCTPSGRASVNGLLKPALQRAVH